MCFGVLLFCCQRIIVALTEARPRAATRLKNEAPLNRRDAAELVGGHHQQVTMSCVGPSEHLSVSGVVRNNGRMRQSRELDEHSFRTQERGTDSMVEAILRISNGAKP